MTQTSIIIPFILLLMVCRWQWILLTLPTLALLHSASVLQIGSFGLMPGYFIGLLVVGRTLVEVALKHHPLNGNVLTMMVPLYTLLSLAVLVLWIALIFFQGKIDVIGGSDAFVIERAAPYVFRRENITQMAYLIMSMVILYAIAHQVARLKWDDIARLMDRSFLIAVWVASILCLWHYASSITPIPWPDGFFHSNPSYISAGNQMLFGELKVNGPFSEPSALAYHFSGFIFYSWFRFKEEGTPFCALTVALCVAVLYLSKSTTSFLAIGAFGGLVAMSLVGVLIRSRIPRPRINWTSIAAVAAMLLSIAGGCVFLINNQSFVEDLFTKMVLEKSESSSFEQRSAVNGMAVDVLVETMGIGIGLGSHKPSSLPLTLLSNVGILGTLAILIFWLDLIMPRKRLVATATGWRTVTLLTPQRWLLLGLLMIHAFSAPNLSSAILWITCGLLCGALAADRAAKTRLQSVQSEAVPVFGQMTARRR